jgi:hypothetical protein
MFATSLQLDSIILPTWADTLIRHTRKATVQSQIILKAFSKTLAPQILTTAKDLSRYYIMCGQGAGAWAMNRAGIMHNPVQAAVRAAYAEMTSVEALATYRRIRGLAEETAMYVLAVGLCGVVAVSVGVDLAQKGYRTAAKLYRAVYGRLNPSEPQPELLPSVNMATASTELAAALDGSVCGGSFLRKHFHNFATVAEADVKAKVEAEAEAIAEVAPDFWAEPLPNFNPPPVVGPVWNPAPRSIHKEVAARLQYLHYVPLTLAPALEPVAQPVQELQPEQKPTRRGRSKAETQPKAATKAKRKPAKAGV